MVELCFLINTSILCRIHNGLEKFLFLLKVNKKTPSPKTYLVKPNIYLHYKGNVKHSYQKELSNLSMNNYFNYFPPSSTENSPLPIRQGLFL